MQGDITPEEKLLKLIKEGAQPSLKSTQEGEHSETRSTPPSSGNTFKSTVAQKHYRKKFVQQLSFLTWGLMGLFILLLGYQCALGRPVWPVAPRIASSLSALNFPLAQEKTNEEFESYTKIFNSRNIFKSIGEPPPTSLAIERSLSFSDRTKGLHLSGIILGDHNQAIVEDRSTGQVYYVVSGDYMGSLQVVDVEENRVIIRFGDEEGQLSL